MRRLVVSLLFFIALGCAPLMMVAPESFVRRPAGVAFLSVPKPDGTGRCVAASVAPNLFVSAAHCYGGGMRLDGRPAQLFKINEASDLMLLTAKLNLEPFVLGRRPVWGQKIFVLGHIGDGIPILEGWVMDPAMIVPVYPTLKARYSGVLRYGGLSGAPIVNIRGELIGVHLCGAEGAPFSCGALYDDLVEMFDRFVTR